jgi:hypothetical protein
MQQLISTARLQAAPFSYLEIFLARYKPWSFKANLPASLR